MASEPGRFRVKPCAEYGVEIPPAKPRMAGNPRRWSKKRRFVVDSMVFCHLGLAKTQKIWSLARPAATLTLNHVTRQHHSI
jgi:hypothetical protein